MFAKKFFSFSLYRLKNILCTNVPKQTNSNITSLYHKMYHLSTFVSFMSVVSIYILVILHLVSLLCSDMKKVEMMFVSFYYYMIHRTNTVQQRSSCVQQQKNRLQCKMNPFHKIHLQQIVTSNTLTGFSSVSLKSVSKSGNPNFNCKCTTCDSIQFHVKNFFSDMARYDHSMHQSVIVS